MIKIANKKSLPHAFVFVATFLGQTTLSAGLKTVNIALVKFHVGKDPLVDPPVMFHGRIQIAKRQTTPPVVGQISQDRATTPVAHLAGLKHLHPTSNPAS